jgi:hypothetical protein
MLRDNLAGLIEPMLSSAGAYLSRCALTRTSHRNDRPQNALKIPARQGGIYALTENVPSPLHAEPRHLQIGVLVAGADADIDGGSFLLHICKLTSVR